MWFSILWLLIVFGVMWWLRRWIEAHMQGVAYLISGHPTVAVWIFFLFFLPGTLLHELSHWLMAKLLLVRTGRITLWPQVRPGRSMWLGSIQVGRCDPLRSSLIGLAPLLSGSLVVTLIGAHLQLDALGSLVTSGQWAQLGRALARSAALPDFWLWVYLLFAVANRMLPSPIDRQPWKPVLIFLAGVTAAMLTAGWTPRLDVQTQSALQDILGFWLYAFSLSAVTNLGVALLLGVIETIVVLVRRQRISYQ